MTVKQLNDILQDANSDDKILINDIHNYYDSLLSQESDIINVVKSNNTLIFQIAPHNAIVKIEDIGCLKWKGDLLDKITYKIVNLYNTITDENIKRQLAKALEIQDFDVKQYLPFNKINN